MERFLDWLESLNDNQGKLVGFLTSSAVIAICWSCVVMFVSKIAA